MSESMSMNDRLKKLVYGKKYQPDKKSHKVTVQDLLSYDEITENGIVRADDAYFAIIEVSQINSHLLDFNESSNVWFSFRTMLNSINIRHSLILQSRFYDVTDFVKSYETRSKALNNLTPELENAREDVLDYYMDFSEEKNREQHGYIMFRFNPSYEGLDLGLSTGNAKIDEFFTKIKSKSSAINDEESRSVAISMLEEVCDLAYHLLYTIGCSSVRLNREGVLEYMYSFVNRDLTVHQRFSDALSQGMFNTEKISHTPRIIVEAIDSILSDDELYTTNYTENNFQYKDDTFTDTFKTESIVIESAILENQIENENETNISISDNENKDIENITIPESENNNSTTRSEEYIAENIQVDNKKSIDESRKVVDIKALGTEGITAEEKARKRRAEARKRKKERARAEKLEGNGHVKLNGTGSA